MCVPSARSKKKSSKLGAMTQLFRTARKSSSSRATGDSTPDVNGSEKQDAYLAKPSGPCCLKGTIHEGKPRGSWATVAEVETYITEPPPGKANGHVVLYFPDVWGMFPNGLLVMDAFADAGYLTIGLDYFRGDPVWKHRKNRHEVNPNFDYEAWKRKHTAFADVVVPKWVAAVKEEYGRGGEAKFVSVGYCFGAPYVCNSLADGSAVAGAFAHPAFLKEHHFYNLKRPLFLSCSEIDHTFDLPSRRRAIDILQAEKKMYHYQLFSNVEHGFALRGDPEDPYQRWVKEQSHTGIVNWFNYWLSQEDL